MRGDALLTFCDFPARPPALSAGAGLEHPGLLHLVFRSFHRVLECRHERRQSALVAPHNPPTSALMILRNRSRSTPTAFGQ